MQNALIPRDSKTVSLWQKDSFSFHPTPSTLPAETIFDVLIIGGGITGITTALLLQQQGKRCVIAEAKSPGYGTTGGTSAHLATFFDTSYDEIENDFGEEAAKLVAEASKESFSMITALIKKLAIDCDFEYKDAFLFSETDKESKRLEEILASSRKAGIEAVEERNINVPMPFQFAVLFKEQGQFHPLKYIYGLAKAFTDAGGIILENTLISETSVKDKIHIATHNNVSIKARNLVYATHIPPTVNLLHLKNAPYRSYILGIRLKDKNYPAGLAYDMQEPYHYMRTHEIEGQKYLILGGEDHKTGHSDPEKSFQNLEAYAKKYYKIESIDYRWSAQYYVPTDGLPYIGQMPGATENTYVATGYNGDGMIFGSLAACIISDQIMKRENRYTELFNPSRIKPIAGFQDFLKENADVAYHFVADRLLIEDIGSLKELMADSGVIVDYKDQKLAIYKDQEGKISALNPVCTHAGCLVNFNPIEKSWDCPCHGGRYDVSGKVLTGPPRHDLQKIDIQ